MKVAALLAIMACSPPPPAAPPEPAPRPPAVATPPPAPAAAPGLELPPGFIDLHDVAPAIVVDLMYLGADNFVGRPVVGYRANRCYLTVAAARALARAQARLQARGPYALRVRDCYRPEKAVADLVGWAHAADRDDLLRAGYIATVSGHSRGGSVDLDIVATAGGALAMGTAIDEFGPRAHTAYRNLTAEERAHRRLLLDVMRPDFHNYAKEWWHFVLADPPPARSYDFDVDVAR